MSLRLIILVIRQDARLAAIEVDWGNTVRALIILALLLLNLDLQAVVDARGGRVRPRIGHHLTGVDTSTVAGRVAKGGRLL